MIILDENIPENQVAQLRAWRIRVRQIGFEIGKAGMDDENIITLLSRQRRSTFFTRDRDFVGSHWYMRNIAWCRSRWESR
ncbi:MAG: DUF5615 family PIN-like protein [Gemmataceae bacterium]